VFGISVAAAVLLVLGAWLIAYRRRRTIPKMGIRLAVGNLNSLGKDESPLLISNRGRSGANHVVVSMRIRNTTFEFDEIPSLHPAGESSLTWRQRVGRFKLEELGIAANWLRTAFRSAVMDTKSELRVPIAIHYQDDAGTERTDFQVLHCDEQLRIRVTDS
jgi:hypothetical protein